jgi:hypothetical protein
MSFWKIGAFGLLSAASLVQDPHAGHHGMQHAPPAPPPSANAPAGAPAATLKQDTLDAPAATSVAEAARAQPSHHMSHGTYVHQDVGREPQPTPSPASHEEHKH